MAERKEILIAFPMGQVQKAQLEEAVKGGDYDCRFTYTMNRPVTEEEIRDKHVIFGGIDTDLIKKAKALEWLQLPSAGADAYTVPGVLKENVILTNASGAHTVTVAEHMIALTFALYRRLHEYIPNQRKRLWKIMGMVAPIEESTVLILGMGSIGTAYARKMRALGAYVIGVRRNEKEKPDAFDSQYLIEDLDKVLPRADIVAMVLPGGEGTDNLMDERRLRLMREGSVLINVGRGNAVDEDALVKVLEEGHLFGAALDVTREEPLPSDSPLWGLKNLIITPHVASNFLMAETRLQLIKLVANNLRRWSRGEELVNIVDRSLGY